MSANINFKDIGQLSQKATIAGTEKIPVSDTEYVTANQIASLGGGGGGGGVSDVTLGGTSVVSSGVAVLPAYPTVPTISTDIETDKASDAKTASPKAVYDEVHPAVGSSQPAGGMLPNVFYDLGTLSGDTTFAFASPSDNTIENEWMFEFTTPSTAPTITWPNAITGWSGGTAPTIKASKTYQVSVLNGLGVIAEF